MQITPKKTREVFNILSDFTRIFAQPDIQSILHKTIKELIDITDAIHCSIYLVPDLLADFDGKLLRDGKEVLFDNINQRCIVLAQTSQERLGEIVNKAFYFDDEDLTGWAYKHNKAINIRHVEDKNELQSFGSNLTCIDKYGEIEINNHKNQYKSILVVPLHANNRSIGVVKLLGKKNGNGFSAFDNDIAKLAANLSSRAIYNAAELQRHNNSILELIEVGAKQDLVEIMLEATKGLRDILHGDKSQIYTPVDDANSALALRTENGKEMHVKKTWGRSNNLIGWVYKTGKPLIIEDIRFFNQPKELNSQLLEKISDGIIINRDDRYLHREEPYFITTDDFPITFLAAPIKQDGETLGVISVQSKFGESLPRSTSFTRTDLQLVESFSGIILNSIDSDQKKILSELFTEMGFTNDVEKLYSSVINRLPKLVSSSGCSIFENIKDVSGQRLKLVATTRKGWIKNGTPINISYQLGMGKTGFCGFIKSALIFNHFGAGDLSELRMDEELQEINDKFSNDITDRLIDNNGIQVGIIQIRNGLSLPREHKDNFQKLKNLQKPTEKGLPSSHSTNIANENSEHSWSFAAIPIQDEKGLLGVITVGRPVSQNPFSIHDVKIIESIAGRLATVMGGIRMQEERKELFISLAHEINTPLTGILAHSENMVTEALGDKEILGLARSNLEQVLRLHLLTETIMGVLSNREPVREFKYQNIGRVLRKAASLFEAEALHKGCNILEPRSVSGEFPDIEMSEFDLLIALKNIIHNAVKYSFEHSIHQEKARYIKIWGGHMDSLKKQYRINVQNYGIGISAEEIESRRIFESFYRGANAGDRRRTGAGFGLAYARRIIEDLHDGKINVTSIPQGGDAHLTTFSIILPISKNWSN